MNKKLLLWISLLVLIVPIFASAAPQDGLVLYYDFDDDSCTTQVGVNNCTVTGATHSTADPISGGYFEFDGVDDWIDSDAAIGISGVEIRTMCMWARPNIVGAILKPIGGWGLSGAANHVYYTFVPESSTSNIFVGCDGGGCSQDSGVPPIVDQWALVCTRFDGTDNAIFRNGTQIGTNFTHAYDTDNTVLDIGRSHTGTFWFNGSIDEVALWNTSVSQADLLLFAENRTLFPTPPVVFNTSLEQSFVDRQDATITIGGGETTIISDTFTIPINNSDVYVTGNLQLVSNQNNELTCNIMFDGDSHGSTQVRTNTAGETGSMFFATTNISADAGDHTVELVCQRSMPSGNVQINNGIMILHNLINDRNQSLFSRFMESNFTVTEPGFPVVDSFIFTTSNETVGNAITRNVVINWDGQYTYAATSNITTEIRMEGLISCEPYPRFGEIGDQGVIGGECVLQNATQGTDINISIRGNGTGNVSLNIHVKEFLMDHQQINSRNLNSTTNEALAFKSTILISAFNMSINNTDRTSANLFVKAGIPVKSNSTDTIASCQLVVFGPKNYTGVIHNRTVTSDGFGTLIVEDLFEDAPIGDYQVILFGSCVNGDCIASPTQMVAYLTDREAFQPNFFQVSAQNSRTLAAINNFSINTTEFFINTTTGEINISTSNPLFNFTVSARNFFNTIVTEHNTSFNITVNLTQHTIINATDLSGNSVSTFTVNFTQVDNTTNKGSASTTNGQAFLPLFDGNFTVTIFDAQNASIFFATTSINLSANPFNVSHTFLLSQSNTFNLQILYEINRTSVNNRVVDLEFISNLEAINTSTSNGTLTISMLQPSIIDIRYSSDGFRERSFFFNLVNQSVNNITLYMLEDTDSTLIIITNVDQSGQPIEGATLQLLRGFIIGGQEVFEVVEMDLTDFAGEGVVSAELNDVRYIVRTLDNVADNNILFVSNPFEITSAALRIVLNTLADPLTSFRSIIALGNDEIVVSIPFYSNVTSLWSATFLIPNAAIVTEVCLRVDQITNFGFRPVNQTCVTGNSGNITTGYFDANLGSRANLELETTTLFSSYLLSTNTFDPTPDFTIYGGTGVFVGTWVISTIALAFLSNAALMIIALMLSLSGVIALNLIGLSWASYLSLVITGAIILFKMRK